MLKNIQNNELKKIELLQDNIVVPYEHLQRKSSSLDATIVFSLSMMLPLRG
jgi:hypothetical protein